MQTEDKYTVEIPRQCEKGAFFRIEKYGKIRLILPDDKVILIGNYRSGLLLLYKKNDKMSRRSFTTGIPVELWEHFKKELKYVAIHIRGMNKFYQATQNDFAVWGYTPGDDTFGYFYLSEQYWTPVNSLPSLMEVKRESSIRKWEGNKGSDESSAKKDNQMHGEDVSISIRNYLTPADAEAVENCRPHAPTQEQSVRYERLNAEMQRFMSLIYRYCPLSKERSQALTKVEEARMWATASIAKNEDGAPIAPPIPARPSDR